MATVTFEIRECLIKTSSNCTGTFQRQVKRGRPPVGCEACRKSPVVSTPTRKMATTKVESSPAEERTGECPCGNKFVIKGGRGRKPTKCEDCRTKGTVYRLDADGLIQTIQADMLEREARERAEEAGKQRAMNLIEMMKPLLKKRGIVSNA